MFQNQLKKWRVAFMTRKGKKYMLIIVFALFVYPLFAQNTLVTTTLNKAKALRNEKKFAEAAAVLGNFEKKYPGNLWVEQLYAQTLFWMKKYPEAAVIYQRAIGFHPEHPELKYDYAVMLFAENKLKEAEKQLLDYTSQKQNNAAAEALLGKIMYYQSQFHRAEKHLRKAVQLSPGDTKTQKLYRQVFRIVSPQLALSARYIRDNQPLQTLGSGLRFHWYYSDVWDFDVSGQAANFSDIPGAGWITTTEIGNRFHFKKAGIILRVSGDWFYSRPANTHGWGGSLQFDKKFGRLFKLSAVAQRTNYTYTQASVSNNLLMINQYAVNFSFGKPDGWNGMAGVRYQFFPDHNWVSAYYAWFLSRPIRLSGFNLAFGYAFNFMNSVEDRFVPKSSPQPVRNSQNQTIEGVYVPYFTPHNQYANAVLVNFNYRIATYATLYGHASVGVYSRTYAPGYSLSNNGVPQKSFAYQSYTPLDLGLSFQTDISRKASLGLSYSYLQTYYYNSHNARLFLRFYF
jgi:tetratricopeptide (TPR) repeat protein